MPQKLINIQEQQQQQLQQQHLTPVQLQMVKMLEMPVAQIEDHIRQELDANPSLETDYSDGSVDGMGGQDGTPADAPYASQDNADHSQTDENERRTDALNDALDRIGQDDRMDNMMFSDDYTPRQSRSADDDMRPMEAGNQTSFIDTLREQMRMEDMTEKEEAVMDYLICSLDDDGLLRKDTLTISDELAIYENIYAEPDEIEGVIMKLQEFNPAGIGARSLQECLVIQIERMKATPQTMLMYEVVTKCYDDFINNRWQKICKAMRISPEDADRLRKEIRHSLNPKPGAALNETQGRALNHITPDIILTVDEDNNISFELNNSNIPPLRVVAEDVMMLEKLQKNATRAEREALAFTQQYVDRAKIYIEALRQRNETMMRTMRAIISMQRKYFISGDENDLEPMVLKDVAERTGYDISTISRASRSKYVMTAWGTFPLKHFFSEGYDTGEGNTVSTKAIKMALKEAIEGEDPKRPYSDDKLVSIMKDKGFPIARRTIAKYREQIGIPVARLRKRT